MFLFFFLFFENINIFKVIFFKVKLINRVYVAISVEQGKEWHIFFLEHFFS